MPVNIQDVPTERIFDTFRDALKDVYTVMHASVQESDGHLIVYAIVDELDEKTLGRINDAQGDVMRIAGKPCDFVVTVPTDDMKSYLMWR
ncbi:MAG: hypothetical protein HYW26_04300 [Candidatus Aenigmarchaeota archaeon]|nr:hypothetical protein [Candidatus Aenigmarchaeota archaeon]